MEIAMSRKILSSVLLSLTVFAAAFTPVEGSGGLPYPQARKSDQVDDLHGSKVADPYRWLEDADAPETRGWIEAENKLTFGFLEKVPARHRIKARLTKLWNFERYASVSKDGARYFLSRNDGLQNQNVLYTMKTLDATPTVLLDPNTLSKDGTVAVDGYRVSEDGKYLAYSISDGGSDWRIYKVRDIDTVKDTSDELRWVKFSVASWSKDGKGFYYSRYDEPKDKSALQAVNYFQKLYYHKIGTPQSQDELVYERPDQKEWGFGGEATEDGRYLVITVSQGTEQKNRVFYKDLTAKDSKVVELLNDFDAEYNFVGNDGPVFFFHTDNAAPRSRLIAIDTTNPKKENWKTIIPETKDTLQGVSFVGDMFIAGYLKDAHSLGSVHKLDGTFVRKVDLPGLGTAGGFGGRRKDNETFYAYTSFTSPTTVYRYDIPAGKSTIFKQPKVDFNPDDYTTKQIFYSSKDGAQIPMFITHRKDVKLDGNNPTYLYGYGGFKASITPTFSVSRLVWMEMGGVLAVANLRGGGEYGQEWHDAGRLKNKQNVFDDFISAGEWLIKNGYTKREKLAIAGGSNGGLLVGACITQRPDLFGAAIPAVGVLDMLRFHKFTIGWAWMSDYGSPDKAEDFKVLQAYSPLHNLKPGTKYPATMITTGDHDDRVVPAHSFKFAAALQAAQGGDAPVLIRVETRAGHGAGKPTQMVIEEQADCWSFLVKALNMDEGKVKD
jgi:prolyl oligopeptidase